jgi:hypothetical protein
MIDDVTVASVAHHLAKARGRKQATPDDKKQAKRLVRAFNRDGIGMVLSPEGIRFLGMPKDLSPETAMTIWLAVGGTDPSKPIELHAMPGEPIPFPNRKAFNDL